MTDHKPLPVAGYTQQPPTNVELANEGKRLEEAYLRWLDKLYGLPDTDKCHVALARTNIEQGAMWAVRSIFRPQRIALDGDTVAP